MSPKSVVLIGAAVLVLGAGLYLFVQVRATPAEAHVTAATPSAAARPSREPDRSAEPRPAAAEGAMPGPRGGIERVRVGNTMAAPQDMAAPAEDPEQRVNVRHDSMMELANKAYDRQDFDEALAIAGKVLSKDPTNVRMLRIMVSANCIAGDSGVAQEYYVKLPTFDREQMKTRCDRYGVTFTDP